MLHKTDRFRVCAALWLVAGTASSTAAEAVSFNRDIRPILSENCFACHGFDKNARKAKLRLDVPGEGVEELIEKDADGMSEFVARIISDDPDEHMPPPDSKKRLSAGEVELLKRWIDEGAEYESHWAWIPPQKPPTPAAAKGREIDHFVRRQLEETGLATSPPALEHRLVRRLYLDLIGLPPDSAEVGEFSIDHYEETVDQLLASSHFGEKWAIMWLDLTRYADTVGYHGDQPVSVSPFRDYVINALNSNKPYDVFTREQIAGDLMPDATDEQRVASGFNRLNMTTEEGGSQPKEYLAKYAADRVRTTSTVFMGATLGCAECHDHKFDPYTTKDFYSFAAFFADVEEVGVYGNRGRPPEMLVQTPETRTALERAQQALVTAESHLAIDPPGLDAGRAKWMARLEAELAGQEPFDFAWLEDSLPAGAEQSGAWKATQEAVFSGTTAWRQEAPADTGVQHYFRHAAEPITLGDGDKFFFYVKLDPDNPPKEIMLQVHSKSLAGGSTAHSGGRTNHLRRHR